MSKPELLPCPFCGEQAVEDETEQGDGQTRYEVVCSYCCGSMCSYTSMKRAIKGWNVRAAPELLEACRAMLSAFEYSGRQLVGAEFEAKEKLLAAVEKVVQS